MPLVSQPADAIQDKVPAATFTNYRSNSPQLISTKKNDGNTSMYNRKKSSIGGNFKVSPAMKISSKRQSNCLKRQQSPHQISINKALSRISSVQNMSASYNKEHLQKQMRLDSDYGAGLAPVADQEVPDYLSPEEMLWSALENNKPVTELKALCEDLTDINTKNVFDDGWTALHYAAHEGSEEACKFLIEEMKAQIDPRTT